MNIGGLPYVLRAIWQEPSNHGQRLHRLLLFSQWQLRKRLGDGPATADLFNGMRLRVYPDCDTSPSALYYAIPNGTHISFLRRHLNGGTFVDVGANVGLVTLLVADKVQHAVLFEPNPVAAERAKENLRLNHLDFQVVAQALSDRVGNVELENAAGVSSCSRTVDGFSTLLPTITVPRTTFDQFLRESGESLPPVSAVKIDVEGHENSVLRGMTDFLKSRRPRLVMFEYLQRTDIVETLRIFRDVDYSVFELSPAGPQAVTNKVDPLQDLFACPAERAKDFGIAGL